MQQGGAVHNHYLNLGHELMLEGLSRVLLDEGSCDLPLKKQSPIFVEKKATFGARHILFSLFCALAVVLYFLCQALIALPEGSFSGMKTSGYLESNLEGQGFKPCYQQFTDA